MTNEFVINDELMKSVEGTTLFYPCSGNDFIAPLQLFSPFVSEFWFVDSTYFTNGDRADRAKVVFSEESEYELTEKPIVLGSPTFRTETRTDPKTGKQYPHIEPCVLTETYRHRPTGKTVTVHRRRGCGKIAFEREITSVGVFYYRGDSGSEGGSGTHWLWRKQFKHVLSKLISGGLVVTDGSEHTPRADSEYRELWKFHGNKSNPHIGKEAVDLVTPFTDKDGVSFSCVGYAGHRYGPTLIWRVLKPT